MVTELGLATPDRLFYRSIDEPQGTFFLEIVIWKDPNTPDRRAVAALAGDPNVLQRTGQVLVAARLAQQYGFTDEDGKTPRPLTLSEA